MMKITAVGEEMTEEGGGEYLNRTIIGLKDILLKIVKAEKNGLNRTLIGLKDLASK